METQLKAFFSRFKSETTPENIYIPNEGKSTLRIEKTIIPENRGTFNETFESAKRELDKLKFNK